MERLPIINTLDAIFDEGLTTAQNNNQMMGSRKPDNEAYELTTNYILTYDATDGEFCIIKGSTELTFDLFRELSTQEPKQKFNYTTLGQKSLLKLDIPKSPTSVCGLYTQATGSELIDEYTAYSNIIDIKYIDDYGIWSKLVWAFHSMGDELKPVAELMSKRSVKFELDCFDKVWDCGKTDGKATKEYIWSYAKRSNEAEYNKIHLTYNKKATDFESVAKNFELIHAKIINKSIFIKLQPDRTFTMFSEKALKIGYSHLVFDDWIKTKEGGYYKSVGFIGKWLNGNSNQRRYDDLVNNPYCGKIDPNEDTKLFNIWSGFDGEFIKPDTFVWKQDALDIILNHISILCNHQKEVADYIIKWIGQMIQFPKVKSICPTLISKEGAGKGTLLLLIRRMLGDSKVMETTTPSRDVWGTFNNLMANSFLVVLNEMSKKDTTDAEGIIKGLFTDPKITINMKGVNPFEINSFHRFMITTNNEDPITSKKDDRRNLIYIII
jgi:hypothetical protein